MEAVTFKPGDKVAHKLLNSPDFHGEVVRVSAPYGNGSRRVYWKGWDPFNPERVDWTWDYAMEKLT